MAPKLGRLTLIAFEHHRNDELREALCRMHVPVVVGLGGLEPPASPLSGVRSNHLSYRPIMLQAETAKHALGRADVQVSWVDVLRQRTLPFLERR